MDAVHQVHTWNSTQRQAKMLLNVYVEGQNEESGHYSNLLAMY